MTTDLERRAEFFTSRLERFRDQRLPVEEEEVEREHADLYFDLGGASILAAEIGSCSYAGHRQAGVGGGGGVQLRVWLSEIWEREWRKGRQTMGEMASFEGVLPYDRDKS